MQEAYQSEEDMPVNHLLVFYDETPNIDIVMISSDPTR